jgi:hypothetical protein
MRIQVQRFHLMRFRIQLPKNNTVQQKGEGMSPRPDQCLLRTDRVDPQPWWSRGQWSSPPPPGYPRLQLLKVTLSELSTVLPPEYLVVNSNVSDPDPEYLAVTGNSYGTGLFRIQIQTGSGFNWVSGSGIRSRQAKNCPSKRKEMKEFYTILT